MYLLAIPCNKLQAEELLGGTKSYRSRQKSRPGLWKTTQRTTCETRREQRKAHAEPARPLPAGISTRGSSPSTPTAAAARGGEQPAGHPAGRATEGIGRPCGDLGAGSAQGWSCGRREKSAWEVREGAGDEGRGRLCLTTGCRAEGRLRTGFM